MNADLSSLINRRGIALGVIATAAIGSIAQATEHLPILATSTPILRDIVANIVGDHLNVISVIPDNADPHTWEPTPDDMVRVSQASGLIFFDAHVEPFVGGGGMQEILAQRGISPLQITDHVQLHEFEDDENHDADHDHSHGHGDPHIWLDPLMIVEAIPAIVDYLTDLDSANAKLYVEGGEQYAEQLLSLHDELVDSFAPIPDDQRQLLVFHDAWSYFAERYDFEIVGVVLESPDGEPSARDIVRLLDIINNHNIQAVFAEPQFNTTVLDVLADEGDMVIATLLTDSFTEDVTTYIELMRFNRDQLVSALAS